MADESIRIERAATSEVPTVVSLVGDLLTELGGFQAFDATKAAALCERLLAANRYVAFLARDAQGETLGVLTLQECPALYVAGCLG